MASRELQRRQPTRRPRRSSTPLILLGVAVGVGVGIGAMWWLNQRNSDSATPALSEARVRRDEAGNITGWQVFYVPGGVGAGSAVQQQQQPALPEHNG